MSTEILTETIANLAAAGMTTVVASPVVVPGSNAPITWDDDGAFFTAFKYKRRFRFVKMDSPTLMRVWEQLKEGDWHRERLGAIDVRQVDIHALKAIKVWDSLTPEVQQEITNGLVEQEASAVAAKQVVIERLAEARKARKTKYANIPKELTCTECGNVVEIIPSVMAKKAEAKGMMWVDFAAAFRCKKCKTKEKS